MKKHKSKFNNSRLVARVMLIIFLLTSVVVFSGCDMEYNYILGSHVVYEGSDYSPMHFIATSMTDTFDKDDVTFNIAYAMHQAQARTKSAYGTFGESYPLYFALFICPLENCEEYQSFYQNILTNEDDMKNIDGYTFVRGIDEKDAFSKGYGLISTPFFISRGYIYEHTENITIPRKYISEKRGAFMLKFVCFYWNDERQSYVNLYAKTIKFDYFEIDENTIKIAFNKKSFFEDEF